MHSNGGTTSLGHVVSLHQKRGLLQENNQINLQIE